MGTVTSSENRPKTTYAEQPAVNVIGSVCVRPIDCDTAFKEAVLQSNLPILKECIALGIDVNINIEDGNTSLHIAAEKCDTPIMTTLLEVPLIKVNKKNNGGRTPLMNACIVNCREVVQMLLKNHADPNIKTDDGNRALHFACISKSMGVVYDLVQYGANVNVRNVFDVTPLSISVIDYPSMPIAKFILRKGAKRHGTKEFPLLLECALTCNTLERLDIFRILVRRGMDLHQLHPLEHRNCLHYVAISSYLPLVNYLLTFNMDKDLRVQDASGRTPMDIALDHQNYAVFELFQYYVWWRIQRNGNH